MIYPSIDKLLNIVNSKYELVHIAARRSKEMTKKDDSQNIFKLPNYISDGLSFIEKKLEEENGLQ